MPVLDWGRAPSSARKDASDRQADAEGLVKALVRFNQRRARRICGGSGSNLVKAQRQEARARAKRELQNARVRAAEARLSELDAEDERADQYEPSSIRSMCVD